MAANMNRKFELNKNRRVAIRVGAGSALAMMLVACGGGGGDDGSSDELDLRAAYDRVVEGMLREDVIRAVGANPNEESSDGTMYWTIWSENLWVDVEITTGLVAWARWDKNTVPSDSLRKNFY